EVVPHALSRKTRYRKRPQNIVFEGIETIVVGLCVEKRHSPRESPSVFPVLHVLKDHKSVSDFTLDVDSTQKNTRADEQIFGKLIFQTNHPVPLFDRLDEVGKGRFTGVAAITVLLLLPDLEERCQGSAWLVADSPEPFVAF